MSPIKISVIVPAYEAGALLLEALASVSKQEGLVPNLDYEVVIADDGSSSPESLAALDEARRLSWVKVVQTPGRVGPSGARNLAVSHARGEWLSFLDADDLYSPDSLRVRLAAVAEYPEVNCVATDFAEFSASSAHDPKGLAGVIATTPFRRASVQEAYDTGQTVFLDKPLTEFVGTVPFWTGSVFLRKNVFDKLGGFPESYFIGEDIHLWLRIAACGRVAFVPQVTAYCRRGHASLTAGENQMNLKTAHCYAHLIADPLMTPVRSQLRSLIAHAYLSESYIARAQRRHVVAWLMAMHAVRWRPFMATGWRAVLLSPVPVRSES